MARQMKMAPRTTSRIIKVDLKLGAYRWNYWSKVDKGLPPNQGYKDQEVAAACKQMKKLPN